MVISRIYTFPIYAFFILLSFVVEIIYFFVFLKEKKLKADQIASFFVYNLLFIILGAKILQYFQMIKTNPNITIEVAGISSYGGLIGGLLAVILFAFQFKQDIKEYIIKYIEIMPLMYGIAKLGCFFAGCCYGIQYNGIGKVLYLDSVSAPKIYLFPVQLVESNINILIFILIQKIVKDKNYKLGLTLIFTSLSKFSLYYLRNGGTGILNSHQMISILLFISGVIVLYKYKRNGVVEK